MRTNSSVNNSSNVAGRAKLAIGVRNSMERVPARGGVLTFGRLPQRVNASGHKRCIEALRRDTRVACGVK